MSFYCMQKWDHAIKTIPSAIICMIPQRNSFPDALLFYRESPFAGVGGVHCFHKVGILWEFETFLGVKLLPPILIPTSTKQHACASLAAHIVRSLLHKPWSKTDNDVGR